MADFCGYFKMKKLFWTGWIVGMFWAFGAQAQESLVRVGRIQALGKTHAPQDIYDVRIQSPKSAMFSQDGKKLYINALEGGKRWFTVFPSCNRCGRLTIHLAPPTQRSFKTKPRSSVTPISMAKPDSTTTS